MSRENLEQVLNALVPFAKVELERMGHVVPAAGSLDAMGDIELHMPRTGEDGTATELVELLRIALRLGAQRGEYRATGLLMEVRAERPSNGKEVDAIAVHLEAPGESLMAFVPFHREQDGGVEYGDVFFGPADPDAFERSGVRQA